MTHSPSQKETPHPSSKDLNKARNRAFFWFLWAFVGAFYVLGLLRIKTG